LGRQKEPWWSYVKSIIGQYPELQREMTSTDEMKNIQKYEAISNAINKISNIHPDDYQQRLKVIELVYFKKTHNIEGASMIIPCHLNTAGRWQGEFIRIVADELQLP